MRSFRTRGLALITLAILILPLLSLNSSLAFAQSYTRSYTESHSSGLIVPLQMNTSLSSKTSRVGETWTATVTQDVYDGRTLVIPRGSTVEGSVATVDDADRFNESGKIGIEFRSIVFPNGTRVENVDAMLTSLDPTMRNQIDEENRIQGHSSTFKRNVYFIGGGAAGGALIGAIAGGGSGAGIGAGVGAVAGVLLGALNKGRDVEIPAGTDFGMQVLSPLNISTTTAYNNQYQEGPALGYPYNRSTTTTTTTTYQTQVVRLARTDIIDMQRTLRSQGYYRGPINGVFTTSTRQALIDFQDDHNVATTGSVDSRTAELLGLSIATTTYTNDVAQIDPNGQPAYMGVGATHRFLVWREGNLWHIRTTTAGQEHSFEGRVVASNGLIRSVSRVNLEASDFDRLSLSTSRRELNFDFTTAGSMDGLSFYSNADTLTFNLWMDGRLTPQNVYIGRDGTNPVSIPFTLVNE